MTRRGSILAVAAVLLAAVTMPLLAGGKKEAATGGKVTINILTEGNTGITTPGIQSDHVAKLIEEKLGIIMNVENVEGTLIVPKVLAMNASGDLPDLFPYDGDADTYKTLFDSGSILDLTDLAKAKLTNWWANPRLKQVLDFLMRFDSFGTGKLYNISVSNGLDSVGVTAASHIRWDYYKEQGYPKVNGLMDLLPILKRMQDMHPTTAEGKRAWGVSFWSDWALWPVLVAGFQDGYAEGGDYYGNVDISNEKFVPILADESPFWKYVTFYNKANQMGILDPDSFTMKQEQWADKVTAGQVYFMIPGWMTSAFKGAPDQGFALIDTTGGSDKSYVSWGGLVGWKYVLSKKTTKADAIMNLFNWMATDEANRAVMNGVQGQTWDLVGGKPAFKTGILDILDDATNPQRDDVYGYQKYSHLLAALAGGEKDATGMPMNFRFYPDFMAANLTAVEKDQAKFYGVTIPAQVLSRKKYTRYDNAVMAAMPSIDDPAYVQRDANIGKYIQDNWFQLVLAKDDAAFAAVKAKAIADLKAMGWDEQMAMFTKVFEETKAKVRGR
jgi:hypothetical protein